MSKPYYADDLVTLYLGDCREVLPGLDVRADCMVTDPPYEETTLSWDCWPSGWLDAAAAVTRALWCFGSMRMFLRRGAEFTGWRFSQDIVWVKPRPRAMAKDRFARAHELGTFWYRGSWADIYRRPPVDHYYGPRAHVPSSKRSGSEVYGFRDRRTYEDDGTRLMSTVLRGTAGDPRRLLHPAQKPVEVIAPLLTYACPPGGVVIDPFAGSGSTLDAARISGRRAIGVEVDERYAEAAARRLSQGTLSA